MTFARDRKFCMRCIDLGRPYNLIYRKKAICSRCEGELGDAYITMTIGVRAMNKKAHDDYLNRCGC